MMIERNVDKLPWFYWKLEMVMDYLVSLVINYKDESFHEWCLYICILLFGLTIVFEHGASLPDRSVDIPRIHCLVELWIDKTTQFES